MISSYSEKNLDKCVFALQRARSWEENTEGWSNLVEKTGISAKFFEAKIPVFQIADSPELVFKVDKAMRSWSGKYDKGNHIRFTNWKNAKQACKEHDIDTLLLPETKVVSGGCDSVIAQEFIEFELDEGKQKEIYASEDPTLDETIKNLALFIIQTGYCDVKPANNPIISDSTGKRRIVIVDFEHFEKSEYSIRAGLFGGGHVRNNLGLLSYLGPRHIELVAEVARANFSGWKEKDETRISELMTAKVPSH